MIKLMQRAGLGLFLIECCFIIPCYLSAISLSGPILASTVTVNGSVSVSSMSVKSMTVLNYLNVPGSTIPVTGLLVQTIVSSTTTNASTASTSLTPIPGLSATLALSNPANYVRISLSGLLGTSTLSSAAKVSIERDSIDLGQGAFATAYSWPGVVSVGITIVDFPGDTSSHTYRPTFDISLSTQIASFTTSPVGYFIVQEISR